MSIRVTSPNSFSAAYKAAEAPTLPAPTTEILGIRRRLDGGLRRLHVDLEAALALPLEDHVPVRQGEQGVVLAAADVQARHDRRAPLANEDVPGANLLAAEALHAEPLRLGVAAVARAG